MLYLACKWLHFVAVISWMAGILYLFRLLVYQSERGQDPGIHALLDLMARRLYRYITRPAMIAAVLGGGGMIAQNPLLLRGGWLHAKILCLVLLIGSTLYAGRLVRLFGEKAANLPSSKALRMMNEIPTLLMLVIVALAVFRPF